jgi:hypothetical protein
MAAPEPITTYNGGAEPQLDATISITSILADNGDGTIIQGQNTTIEGVLATNGTLTYDLAYQEGGGVSALKLYARPVSADGMYGQSVFLGDATLTPTGETIAGETIYDWTDDVSTASLSSGIYDLEAFAYTSITAADPDFPVASFSNTNNHPYFEYISVVPSDNESPPQAPIAADAGSGELSTDGRYFVFTSNSQTYEMDLQTGTQTALSAGQTPVGTFAAGQTIDSAALQFQQFQNNNYGSLVEVYQHTITSANGAYTFGAIGADHPYVAQGLQPYDNSDYYTGYDAELYPVVTDEATGLTQLLTGFGQNPSPDDGPEGIPVAVSDDGTTVLVENDYLNGLGDQAGSGYYIVHLPAAQSAPSDIFSDVSAATSGPLGGEYLWSNAANWSAGLPANGDSVTLAGYGIDDIATLSLASLNAGEEGAEITGGYLSVNTVTIGNDAGFEADSEITGGAVTIDIGTISGTNAFFEATGANARLVISDSAQLADHYDVSDGGMIVLDNLASTADFEIKDGLGTLALVTPGATIAGSVDGIAPGDVLELPGTTVSHIDFGDTLDSTTTVSVTTNSGIYVFTEASFEGASNYQAAPDTSTGLEAITFTSASTGLDTFSGQAADSSGQFLWSNAANWSAGVPVNGSGAMLSASGRDDIATLSLTSLVSTGAFTAVDGSLLSISTLVSDSATGLEADSEIAGGSSTVSVLLGTITGSGGLYVADGAHASIEVLDSAEPDEIYQAEDGGRIVLDSLSSGSKFGFVGDSTLALVLPGASTSALIDAIAPGDVLELPGTAVEGISFGTNSLEVTTSSGIYDFTNVTYGATVGGYIAGVDSATGLEAITFTSPLPPDTFQDKSTNADAIEPLNGAYLWSDSGNWVAGVVPVNGNNVSETVLNGIDDLDNLSLSGLTLAGILDLIGEHLTLGNVLNNGYLIAQGDVLNPGVTITVNGVTTGGDAGDYIADGSGAVLIDNVPINTGYLFADGGGLLEINSAPGAAAISYGASFLGYYNGPATVALSHPGATITTALYDLEREDVLELPGTSVSAVHFGTASLTITTNAGTYDFTDVSYDGSVTGYVASIDPATGLEAITFTGAPDPTTDVFYGSVNHGDYPTLTGELWSTDENWENKVPRNGDAVDIEYSGYVVYGGISYPDVSADDIAGLSLSSMAVSSEARVLIYDQLTLGALTIAAGANVDDESVVTVEGSTSNDGTISTDPSTIIFDGAVTGTGTIEISAGSDVIFYGSVASTETIEFLSNTGTLTLADPTEFDAKIIGTGIEIVICYLRGTRIQTPEGQVNVETLKIGDTVVTHFGGVQPIKWIGWQSYARRFVKNNRDQLPVRIEAGALGENLPARELYVSPGHSMLIDGTLVLAKSLVNGLTITQHYAPEEIHYYQIELETHDCVLAEGAWSETYADSEGMRNKFHNAREFFTLYPDYRAPAEPQLCAPRPQSGAALDEALRSIVLRAAIGEVTGALLGWIEDIGEDGIRGWAQDGENLELPVLLEVLIGEQVVHTILACDHRGDLAEAGIGQGRCSFLCKLPAGIPPDRLGEVWIKRAADGAALPYSPELQARVGLHYCAPRADQRHPL